MKTVWYVNNKYIPVELHGFEGQYFLEILDDNYCVHGRFVAISNDVAYEFMRQCEEEQIANNEIWYINNQENI